MDNIFAPVTAKRDELLQQLAGDAPRWLDIARRAQRLLPPTYAVSIIRKAVRERPKNANIQFLLAETLVRLGQVAEAQAVAEQIPASESQELRALKLRASIAQRCDQWQRATQAWQQLLQKSPENLAAVRGLARCLDTLGDRKGAIAAYREAIRLSDDRPLNHYALAALEAREKGGWLSLEEIRALHDRYPDDPDITTRYAAQLRSLGDDRSADALIEAQIQGQAGRKRQLAQARARGFLNAQRYSDAADVILEAFADDLSDLRSLITASSWLALGKDYDAAEQLLGLASNGETSDEVLRAQARLKLTVGDHVAALACQAQAVRLCGNLANHAMLCEILLKSGRRRSSAAAVITHIAKTFGDTQPGWSELGVLSLKNKDFSSALAWSKRAAEALIESDVLLQHYANALWHRGQTERAWFVLLALATGRRAFLSPDNAACEQELQALRSELASCKDSLSRLEENAQFIEVSQAMRRLFSKPHLIKWNGRRNPEIGSFMQAFTKLEDDGALESAAELIAEGLDRVVAGTSLSVRLGDLLYRAARVHEALGRHKDALAYLAEALWMNKHDPILLSSYREMLRNHAPPLRTSSEPRVLILIPTWERSAPRASFLAEQVAAETTLTAVTVQGEPELQSVTCNPAPYGYDLRLPCEEGYLALPAKLMLAYRYLSCCSNCVGVFKMDDDAAVADFDRFNAMIRHLVESKADYAGRVLNYHNGTYHHGRHQSADQGPIFAEYRPLHFCRGEGYYLSRRALRSLCEIGLTYYSTDNRRKIFEDVLVAEILDTAGIKPTPFDPVDKGGMLSEVLEPLTLLS